MNPEVRSWSGRDDRFRNGVGLKTGKEWTVDNPLVKVVHVSTCYLSSVKLTVGRSKCLWCLDWVCFLVTHSEVPVPVTSVSCRNLKGTNRRWGSGL